jgi:hypothetical protein
MPAQIGFKTRDAAHTSNPRGAHPNSKQRKSRLEITLPSQRIDDQNEPILRGELCRMRLTRKPKRLRKEGAEEPPLELRFDVALDVSANPRHTRRMPP